MHVRWSALGDYVEVGGRAVLEAAIREAVRIVPPEHQKDLGELIVLDHDPKGRSLGVWRSRRPSGAEIEIYLAPHVDFAGLTQPSAREFFLKLYLAHTIFHEVGHHRTLWLNRRTRPSRKPKQVNNALERWAEEYVPRRLQRLCDLWRAEGGPASTSSGLTDLIAALRFLRIDADFAAEEPSSRENAP